MDLALSHAVKLAISVHLTAGGLADLLEMHPTTLARHLVPAALPVFIDQQDRAALLHLARQAGMPLPTLLHQYGHFAVAKHIFEGASWKGVSFQPSGLPHSSCRVTVYKGTTFVSARAPPHV